MLVQLLAILLTAEGQNRQALTNTQIIEMYHLVPPGLNKPNPDLIPVHDLQVTDHATATVSGYFYLGGSMSGGAWGSGGMPRIFAEPAHSGAFNPGILRNGAHWVLLASTLTPVPQSGSDEGDRVNFQATLPANIDPANFWIAVELRGKSVDDISHDEVSFVAKSVPEHAGRFLHFAQEIARRSTPPQPGSSDNNKTNQIIPITLMRPIRDFGALTATPSEVYTNIAGSSLNDRSLWKLTDPGAPADLGEKWRRFFKSEHAHIDPPDTKNPRMHQVHFNSASSKRFMVAAEHLSVAAGAGSVEWSGVIRPPD